MFVSPTAAPDIYNLGHVYHSAPLLKCTHRSHQWLFAPVIHKMFDGAAK